MRLPLDTDLTVFVFTVGNIVLGSLPQLRKNVPPVPVKYEIEEVATSALTERQSAVFAPYDEKLAEMNYRPVCTYRVSNYGHNLMRSYVNPAETSRCIVMIVETNVSVAGMRPVGSACVLSFETWFADKMLLTTRNMKLKSVLDRPPYQAVQECPYIEDPAEMKRIHDTQVAKMGCPVAPPLTADQVFRNLHQEHDWFCEYQVAQGIFRMNPDGNSYSFADKAHWRGIFNYLNPFVHRFYAWRFLPAALLAVMLPLLGLKFVPAAAVAALKNELPVDVATRGVMLACYALAGSAVGLMFESATFIWVFILTYIPMRILAPGALGPIPYSTFAAVVAYFVSQAKERRRAVLLPQRAR